MKMKKPLLKPLVLVVAILVGCALNLRAQPVITNQPASQTNLPGTTVSFSVGVNGTGPFTYQWQFNGTNLPNIITTVAGNGSYNFSGDGSAATNANMRYPSGVAMDKAGNLFIADANNYRVRKVDTNGLITTVAGNGSIGYSGDGGTATNAAIYYPAGVVVDAAMNIFIADYYNNRIRKVDTNGIITTVAGNGSSGYSGDGGAATSATLDDPIGVAVDAGGNLFIADYYNSRIRKVDTNGIITTVAGNGNYGFSGDGAAATNGSIRYPYGIAVDNAGDLFIADYYNYRIRKVDANGIITTVAGNGINGYAGDGAVATNAKLSEPVSVAVDAANNFYIADTQNNRIRKVSAFASLPTLTLNNVTTNNVGNYRVIVTSPSGSVTSVVATLTVTLGSPAFASTVLNLDGSLTLNLTGLSGNTSRLWAASNLVPPVIWQAISTNFSGGNWQFCETNTATLPSRFYRLSSP